MVVAAKQAGLSILETADLLNLYAQSSLGLGEEYFSDYFGPLVPTEHSLNATACLRIAADNVYPFMMWC